MKVAMIGLRGLGDGLGGVERSVRELSSRLVKQGVEVTVFGRSKYDYGEEIPGVRVENIPTIYTKNLETICYALLALNKASKKDFDIIHIHALGSSLFGWIPRISKQKVVVTIHGLDWQRQKWGWAATHALKTAEKFAVACSNHGITVSKSLHTYFSMRYPGNSFSYIPNGCDVYSLDYLEPPDGFESKNYILFLGRLVPEKGPLELIQAYLELQPEMPLVIAGSARYTDAYMQQIQKYAKRNDRIHLVGNLTGIEKERFMRHAYLFCLPSFIEGLPITLLETMSRGVCPLVSDIPPCLDVIDTPDGRLGFVFPIAKKDQLRPTLAEALCAPELVAELGARSLKHALMVFDWDSVAQETKKTYEVLAAA